MSEVQASDLINTSENKAVEDECRDEPMNEPESVQITDKSVKDLTNEERTQLIANAKNGQDNDFFKVSFDKNGRPRISKKKAPKQNTATKLIENKASRMTTEQLLMEHVIGLESQLSALTQKHKNLKKKYKSMYADVYIDDEEFYKNNATGLHQCDPSIGSPEPTLGQEQQKEQESAPAPEPQQVVLPNIRRYGWRARINPTL